MAGRLTWMCLAWSVLAAKGRRAAITAEVLIVKAEDIIYGLMVTNSSLAWLWATKVGLKTVQ